MPPEWPDGVHWDLKCAECSWVQCRTNWRPIWGSALNVSLRCITVTLSLGLKRAHLIPNVPGEELTLLIETYVQWDDLTHTEIKKHTPNYFVRQVWLSAICEFLNLSLLYWICIYCRLQSADISSKRSIFHLLLCETVNNAEWAVLQESH